MLYSMINERRILMVSETLSRLTACIHSAATLIYPMHWSVLFFYTLLVFAYFYFYNDTASELRSSYADWPTKNYQYLLTFVAPGHLAEIPSVLPYTWTAIIHLTGNRAKQCKSINSYERLWSMIIYNQWIINLLLLSAMPFCQDWENRQILQMIVMLDC